MAGPEASRSPLMRRRWSAALLALVGLLPAAVSADDIASSVVLEVDGSGSLFLRGTERLSGYDITSPDASLVPDASGDASPFQFYVSNTTDAVTAANLSSQIDFDGVLALNAGYSGALTAQGVMDSLDFHYGTPTGTLRGGVVFVPEPDRALLGVGGLLAATCAGAVRKRPRGQTR